MRPIREILIHSGVAAVAVAVLLLWTIDLAFHALWNPFWRLVDFIGTAIAIRGIPYIPLKFTAADEAVAFYVLLYSIESVACLCCAAIPARVIFGCGPLRCLKENRELMLKGRAWVTD